MCERQRKRGESMGDSDQVESFDLRRKNGRGGREGAVKVKKVDPERGGKPPG